MPSEKVSRIASGARAAALDQRAALHRKLHAPVAIGQEIVDPRGGGRHGHFARLRQELRAAAFDPGGRGKARQGPAFARTGSSSSIGIGRG
jgi:hypothetical protein